MGGQRGEGGATFSVQAHARRPPTTTTTTATTTGARTRAHERSGDHVDFIWQAPLENVRFVLLGELQDIARRSFAAHRRQEKERRWRYRTAWHAHI